MTQEQAKNLTFPCKVRVTKARQPSFWYSNKIGQIFTIDEAVFHGYSLHVENTNKFIDQPDCELYEEPKEVNPQHDEQPEKVKLTPDEIYQAWKDGKVVKYCKSRVLDMHKFPNGKIVFEYDGGVLHTVYLAGLDSFTIEEHVEAKFTPVYKRYGMFNTGLDYTTLVKAKEKADRDTTCILEHHKINGKWVFVKAHEIK